LLDLHLTAGCCCFVLFLYIWLFLIILGILLVVVYSFACCSVLVSINAQGSNSREVPTAKKLNKMTAKVKTAATTGADGEVICFCEEQERFRSLKLELQSANIDSHKQQLCALVAADFSRYFFYSQPRPIFCMRRSKYGCNVKAIFALLGPQKILQILLDPS